MSLIYPLIKRKIKASAIFSECNFNFQCRRCRGSSIFFYLQVTLSREKNQLLPPQRSSSHVLDVSKYSFQTKCELLSLSLCKTIVIIVMVALAETKGCITYPDIFRSILSTW
ncbi:uncharacterized protein [Solanum tuberosum]|uniref:uncharacterized protein isoform X1 n=1 Tax=Solanum tuberosum TaxID=4113 RepID=UPI00073A2BAF|nr:PREDICTED: uncharacterized protein LOC107063227 isoform X1 [Solanum tuberosum]